MFKKLRRASRAGLNTAETLNQQIILRRKANNALKGLEKSGYRLSRKMRAEIRDYATDHFGWHGYAEWLSVYTAVAGKFKPGWVPVNYYLAEVMPRINGTYHHIGRRRAMNGYLLKSPAFPDLAYVVNGLVYDRDYNIIAPHRLTSYLVERAEEVVLKLDNSDSGRGVQIMPARNATHGQLISTGDGVVQARIAAHEVFDQFGVSALPTLRVATVITESGQPEVRGCYLKLGRSWHDSVQAGDKLRVPVDPATGQMADRGFMSCWREVRAHPDTGTSFPAVELPMVRDCIDTALRLHKRWPLPRFVSWDMLPDRNGKVQIMEWEGGVVTFAEATQGPCFADLGWDRLHLSPIAAAAGPRLHPIRFRSLLGRGAPAGSRPQPAAR